MIEAARRVISEAEALLICAGAGMGVDSGLPDFRGDKGFWQAYPEAERLGLSFVELANPDWFERDPALAWAFYGSRYQLYYDVVPHKGFDLLRNLSGQKGGDYFIFTSNVDGHFHKAGFDRRKIVECHGSLHYMQCSVPCCDDIVEADLNSLHIDLEAFRADNLPLCERCGKVMRPNVLMFGDWGWVADRSAAQERRFNEWQAQLQGRKLVIIEMGAGLAVPTVRLTSQDMASRHRGTLIRINPRDPQVPDGHISLAMGALAGLEQILGS